MLVDTSVWIDHLRRGDAGLSALLLGGEVECHPFIIGELACGSMRRRSEILALLRSLPQAAVADHDEVLAFVENHGLARRGIGWVDAHLLAAASLSGSPVWTRDRRLLEIAQKLGLDGKP